LLAATGRLTDVIDRRQIVDAATMDKVLLAKLLDEAAVALNEIGEELCPLYDGWTAAGVGADSLAWLWSVLERLGFWSTRLELAADPELLTLFPTLG
jgi:hypothetical protein